MNIVQSYKCKIINMNNIFEPTINIFRKALRFVIPIVNDEWHLFKNLKAKEKLNFAEKLIHKTLDNPFPKYDFDSKFYKFPSYLRRNVIQQAIGIVSSYKSNLENYNRERYNHISNGKKFKKQAPKLGLNHFKHPVLYKGNMFNKYDRTEMLVKIFYKNDWVWKSVKLRNQDVKYIEKNCYLLKESSPSLVKQGRTYYLQFSYESKVNLNKTKIENQTIVAVDLGLNHSAVCCAIKSNGTVIGRKFINQPIEKDHQLHLLNRSKKKYKQTGTKNKMPRVWNKINNLNKQIAYNTVSEIIKFAKQHNADTIAMEYLDIKGKKHNKAMQLQMWAKRLIAHKIEEKAHTVGMRFRQVCAKYTSALAYDGSGTVKRSKKNYSLCTFKTGKQYNCDLNATYNIGARCIINEYKKTISEKKWSLIEAKVPQLMRRTQCTLSTLISLYEVM